MTNQTATVAADAEAMTLPSSSLPADSERSDALRSALLESSALVPSHSLLSDKAILHQLQLGRIIISPFDLSHLSTTSYDVTLGPHYYRESTPEPGCGIYNPYSMPHVHRVWGTARTAEPHSSWTQRTGQPPLTNIDRADRLIWIAPGETILGHTVEYIGGLHSITTMMKARSSMGRNFIEVCKCFPANVRLLTRRGYKFVEFIGLTDEVAAYNPASQEVEFHRPSRVLKLSGTHSMVNVKQRYDEGNTMFGGASATNPIEMATTDDHDWFVQFGEQEENSQKVHFTNEGGREKPFTKVPASSLTGEGKSDRAAFRVLTSVANGCADSVRSEAVGDLPWAVELELDTNAKCDAFLEFYGYWLGDGTIEPTGDISCTPTKLTDRAWLRPRLVSAGLVEGVDFVVYTSTHRGKTERFQIRNAAWRSFFAQYYGGKYKRRRCEGTQGERLHVAEKAPEEGLESYYWPEEDVLLGTKSAKGFVDWVFVLSVRRLRLLIGGVIMADGRAKTREAIFTSSARFRDQLMRVCLFAGYAPHFRRCRQAGTVVNSASSVTQQRSMVATADGWVVFIGRRAMNKLKQTRDVTTSQLQGDVYCVTVPPHHLVIAQTATVENGIVTSASKAIVIGQCAGWGDIGYTNRWTMEITNNSRHYSIPLVVGRRIAQIVFFDSDGPLTGGGGQGSYEKGGKYQSSDRLDVVKREWKPSDMLPKMYLDREIGRPSITEAAAEVEEQQSA